MTTEGFPDGIFVDGCHSFSAYWTDEQVSLASKMTGFGFDLYVWHHTLEEFFFLSLELIPQSFDSEFLARCQ